MSTCIYDIYCNDCLTEMENLINQNIKVDMILTDLPYGVTSCKWGAVIPFNEMWDKINNLVSSINVPIVLFSNQPFTTELIHSNIKNFKYCWTWDKHIPSGMSYAKYRPMQQTEDICIFTKKGDKTNYHPQMIKRPTPIQSGGMKNSNTAYTTNYIQLNKTYSYKNPTTLLHFNKIRQGSLHPTQKPVPLLKYLIKTYTNEHDTVLDFTMRSGSTGVACIYTNRNFIGIEKEKKYYQITKQRLNNAYKQTHPRYTTK